MVVVTGGNSGTGYATCKAYYDRGAKVYMASRSADRAHGAIKAIMAGHDVGLGNRITKSAASRLSGKKGEVIFSEVDLTDLDSVQRFVERIQQ